MSFLAELKRRKVFRVAAGYVVGAWVLIQVVETVFPAFGLDDASFRILVIALAIGLVPTVILAWAFELTRSGLRLDRSDRPAVDRDSSDQPPSLLALLRYRRFLIPVLTILVIAFGSVALIVPRVMNARWARMEAIPEIKELVAADDYRAAFELALEADRHIHDEPALKTLWPSFAVRQTIHSEPAGAEVTYRDYEDPEGEWRPLGTTPIDAVRLPRMPVTIRFEKEGHPATERSRESFDGTLTVHLDPPGSPADQVVVPDRVLFFLLTGFPLKDVLVPTFRIDRHEVTNEEFQAFVDSGGYEDPEYWQDLDFELDDRALSFEEAMDRFRDQTGRPGPAGWTGGAFPAGEADHPVRGVSWFEAMAYARFRGRSLPTIHQWSAAAIFPPKEEVTLDHPQEMMNGRFRGAMLAHSNFAGKETMPVGSRRNPGPFGTYDLPGNVREWCWNATSETPDANRYILGGSFADPSYLFSYGIALSPWDRSAANGFRLSSSAETEELAALREPVPPPGREAIAEISDEIFEIYRAFYDYDRTPLNATTDRVQDDSPYWTRETVSFDAAYGDERVIAHLFLPKNVDPPYQPIIYFPGSSATRADAKDDLQMLVTEYLIHSGRALIYPIIHGTHERYIGLETTWPDETTAYSEHVKRWIQDIRRTLDYAETREDLDTDRIGYYGWSWGGWNGPIVMALDDRVKAGVYISGGIPPTLARPEASSASFASRVSAPVLMISGRHDVLRPVETFQKPMFESLGTAPEHKRHAILEGGHFPAINQLRRETLAWFDKYLGPVE